MQRAFWCLWSLSKGTTDWVTPPLLLAFLDIYVGLYLILGVYCWDNADGFWLGHWTSVYVFPLYAGVLLWVLCMEFIEVRGPPPDSAFVPVVRHRFFDAAGGHILGFTATMAYLTVFTFVTILDARMD